MAMQTFDGRSPEALEDASGIRSDHDEIATEFARKRLTRATGEVNASANWQVRIEWASPEPMTWPTFTYDTKRTRVEAEYCARHALQWRAADSDLRVVGTCVRAPGASAWEPVSLTQAVSA